MKRRSRIFLGGVALVAAAALAVMALRPAAHTRPAPSDAQTLRAGVYDPPRAAPDIALRGSDGAQVTLRRFRGKVVLLTFGFTYCAAVCPTTLATLARARALLGDKGASVQVIFVTVDPERDTAAQMQRYLAAFDRSFIGATGDHDKLAAARAAFGVTATREGSGDDYAMAHTSSIFLIDPAGKLRAMMPFGREAEDFVHDIEILLAEAA